MILEKDWKNIQKIFKLAQKTSMHVSIATVDQYGQPNITPIGTVFLNENQTAYLFDTFTEKLAENLIQNPKACIQAVNSGKLFWLSSLIQGNFSDYPGVRLYVEKRVKPLQWTKGSQLIWSDFSHVRDIKINDFRWIKYPRMMENLI